MNARIVETLWWLAFAALVAVILIELVDTMEHGLFWSLHLAPPALWRRAFARALSDGDICIREHRGRFPGRAFPGSGWTPVPVARGSVLTTGHQARRSRRRCRHHCQPPLAGIWFLVFDRASDPPRQM